MERRKGRLSLFWEGRRLQSGDFFAGRERGWGQADLKIGDYKGQVKTRTLCKSRKECGTQPGLRHPTLTMLADLKIGHYKGKIKRQNPHPQ